MSDPLTNPDRDENHQRRRDLGDEDSQDGLDLFLDLLADSAE